MNEKYFDREGNPITGHRWSRLFDDTVYRQIGETRVNGYYISTRWQGLDMSTSKDPKPLFFDTTVFDQDGNVCDKMELYGSDKEAIEGHKRIVAKYTKKEKPGLTGIPFAVMVVVSDFVR